MANETNFYTYRDLNFFKRVNQIGNLEREITYGCKENQLESERKHKNINKNIIIIIIIIIILSLVIWYN